MTTDTEALPPLPDRDCQGCDGSGTIRAMTSHLGPDDYEFDQCCPACQGTGSADLRDAINALGYWNHRTDVERIVVERSAVLRIISARAALAQRQQKPFAYATLNKQGDIVRAMRNPDRWMKTDKNTLPLYTAPQAAEPVADTEFCWLVELFEGDGSWNSAGWYHTGFVDIGGYSRATKNPDEARRYPTREEAERVAKKLGTTLTGTWKAVEHGFAAPPSAQAQPITDFAEPAGGREAGTSSRR